MNLVLIDIDCGWPEENLRAAVTGLPAGVQARALRYRCPDARRNLIVSQTCLREVMLRLGVPEESLAVCPQGRPWFLNSSLEFNLSHSASKAILAIGQGAVLSRALGVDIEWLDRRLERDALARRFFTFEECEYALGGRDNFFHIWTRKEAVLKSSGIGLRVDLDSFDVLSDEVQREVTGRPLFLKTETRESNYMVSWALPREWKASTPLWVRAFEKGWLEQVAEGIKG